MTWRRDFFDGEGHVRSVDGDEGVVVNRAFFEVVGSAEVASGAADRQVSYAIVRGVYQNVHVTSDYAADSKFFRKSVNGKVVVLQFCKQEPVRAVIEDKFRGSGPVLFQIRPEKGQLGIAQFVRFGVIEDGKVCAFMVEAVVRRVAGELLEEFAGLGRIDVVIPGREIKRVAGIGLQDSSQLLPFGASARLNGIAYIDDEVGVKGIDLTPNALVHTGLNFTRSVAEDREAELLRVQGGRQQQEGGKNPHISEFRTENSGGLSALTFCGGMDAHGGRLDCGDSGSAECLAAD